MARRCAVADPSVPVVSILHHAPLGVALKFRRPPISLARFRRLATAGALVQLALAACGGKDAEQLEAAVGLKAAQGAARRAKAPSPASKKQPVASAPIQRVA